MSSRFVDPIAVDRHLRDNSIALADVRAAIPKSLRRPSAVRSWWALFRVFGSAAVCLFALSQIQLEYGPSLWWQVPALLAMWLVYGWVLVGLFVLGHDCGHQAFSRRRWVNEVVGHLCMAPLFNSYQTWRLTHDHHHGHTQLKGQEVDWSSNLVTADELERLTWRDGFWTRLGYALPFGLFVWIVYNTVRRALSVKKMLRPEVAERAKAQLRLSNLILLTVLVAIYAGLIGYTGIWGFIKYHGMPSTIALLTGALLITIQHANAQSIIYDGDGWTPVRGQLASTFDVRFPRVLEWLWCNINLHVPHHICPTVPWYKLPRAGAVLSAAHPELYQVYRLQVSDLAWIVRAPVLRKVEEGGYYVLDVKAT